MKSLNRNDIARRAARDIPDGSFVNLGIGMPTLIANYIPADREIFLHSENGLVGVGPAPAEADTDWDLIDAGKNPITLVTGAAIFDSFLSFGMMRGGHLDIAALGGFEVASNGDLANWWTGDKKALPAVGGAMDLACGAKSIWVLMDHTSKDGKPRLVDNCSCPLTAKGVVKRVYTNLAVLDVTPRGFLVREMVDGLDFEGLQRLTEARLHASAEILPLAA